MKIVQFTTQAGSPVWIDVETISRFRTSLPSDGLGGGTIMWVFGMPQVIKEPPEAVLTSLPGAPP